MIRNFQVDVSLVDGSYRMLARCDLLPDGDLLFARQPLILPPEQRDMLERLRQGEGKAQQVDMVAKSVSYWLLGPELTMPMRHALQKLQSDRMRIVFHILDIAALSGGSPELAFPDIPLELLQIDDGQPLVLKQYVNGFAHLLPQLASPQATQVPLRWPLQILIVRSNPQDAATPVPAVQPLIDYIRDLCSERFGAMGGHPGVEPVRVDVISGEKGIKRPATWEAVKRQIQEGRYHILVYLGHGAVATTYTDVPAGGCLKMESEDGKGHKDVSSRQLALELRSDAPPLVLLVGCATARQVDGDPPEQANSEPHEEASSWVRGSLGVAQALVNGETGVQVAIGMRYNLDAKDGLDFLRSFFESLIKKAPGNVEAALCHARSQLASDKWYPPTWSAPAMYRTDAASELLFAFMETPLGLSDEAREFEEYIEAALAGYRTEYAQATGASAAETIASMDALEELLRNRLAKEGPLLMPSRLEWAPDRSRLSFNLYGDLSIDTLEGVVTWGSDAIQVSDARIGPGPAANGFRLQTGQDGASLAFTLQRKKRLGGAESPLPGGLLFDVAVQPGTVIGQWNVVDVQIERIEPQRSLWIARNAVIFPR